MRCFSLQKGLEKDFSDKKITEDEKENKLKEGLENLKKELRKKFILDKKSLVVSESPNIAISSPFPPYSVTSKCLYPSISELEVQALLGGHLI